MRKTKDIIEYLGYNILTGLPLLARKGLEKKILGGVQMSAV